MYLFTWRVFIPLVSGITKIHLKWQPHWPLAPILSLPSPPDYGPWSILTWADQEPLEVLDGCAQIRIAQKWLQPMGLVHFLEQSLGLPKGGVEQGSNQKMTLPFLAWAFSCVVSPPRLILWLIYCGNPSQKRDSRGVKRARKNLGNETASG